MRLYCDNFISQLRANVHTPYTGSSPADGPEGLYVKSWSLLHNEARASCNNWR
jgi:hypothetical protein